MTDEPYRWLEAIANRREYIRDQLKGATPVVAVSRPEGVLLFGVGTGKSKVFEVYDRQGLAALGHPVDIEKVRQTVIEAAHLEGFTRAAEDVSVRRLVNFALSPLLKTTFEQIFSAPLIVESILAEVGTRENEDVLARLSFDGTFRMETTGIAVAHTDAANESAAAEWLRQTLPAGGSLRETVHHLFAAYRVLLENKPFAPPAVPLDSPLSIEGKVVELALLERAARGRVRYRELDVASLP